MSRIYERNVLPRRLEVEIDTLMNSATAFALALALAVALARHSLWAGRAWGALT